MFDSFSSHPLHERTLELTVALYRVTDYFPKSEILRNHLRAKGTEVFERVMEYDSASEFEKELDALIQKIRTIKGYLAIASTLNYVRSINFAILEKEYDILERFLEDEKATIVGRPIHEDIQSIERRSSEQPLIEKRSMGHNLKKEPELKDIIMNHGGRDINSSFSETSEEIHGADVSKQEEQNNSLNDRQKIIIDKLKGSGQAKISDFFLSFKGVSSKTIQRDLQNLCDKQMVKREGDRRWTIYTLF